MTPKPWPTLDLIAWIALATTGACTTMRFRKKGEIGDILAFAGRLITASVFVLGAGGALVMLLGPLVAGSPADPGKLASLRTVLLSIAVVGLGLSRRWRVTSVFARLVYPVLIVGGIRLVLDDFRHSSPSTLFIALACFGLALVIGPRLAARPRPHAT